MPSLSSLANKLRKATEPSTSPGGDEAPPPYEDRKSSNFIIRAAKNSDARGLYDVDQQFIRNSLRATLDEPHTLSSYLSTPLTKYGAAIFLVAVEPKGGKFLGQALVLPYQPLARGRRSCFDHVGRLWLTSFTVEYIGDALHREVVTALIRETLIAGRAATNSLSTIVTKAVYSPSEPELVLHAELLEQEGFRRVGGIEGAIRKSGKVFDEAVWQWDTVEPNYGAEGSKSKGEVDVKGAPSGEE